MPIRSSHKHRALTLLETKRYTTLDLWNFLWEIRIQHISIPVTC